MIADLHGGNLDDVKAQEEFREIKGAVEQEVSDPYSSASSCMNTMAMSATVWYKIIWRNVEEV